MNEDTILTNVTISVYLDDLLSMAVNDTVLRFQSMPDGSGANLASDHAMTEADRDWFQKKLRFASDKVYQSMVAFSRHSMTYVDPEVTDPRERQMSYQFLTVNPENSRHRIIYQIRVGENYDPNLNDTLISLIEDCLVSYCLYEWYRLKGMTRDSIDKYDNYSQRLKDIKNTLNLRITPVTRPYVGI